MTVMLNSILTVRNAQKQYGLRGLEIMVETIRQSGASKEDRQVPPNLMYAGLIPPE
ncbi:MAG: hypothetical protein M3270_03480 [Thermoproteota archaeon]|nr:hypothetical protein [Thermoproteota archaeon]